MSHTPEFHVADVVRLRSGGPPMTVRELKPEAVVCAWFDAHNVEHEDAFKPEMLIKPVSRPEPSRRGSPYDWMRQA